MHGSPSSLDLNVDIQTAENIQFEYRLAGPFRRVPALVLDFLIRAMILAVLFIGGGILFGFLGIAVPLGNLFNVLLTLSYFVLTYFYGMFFEAFMGGRTPGKWITNLRVVTVDGNPIGLPHAALRNLLRVVDFGPPITAELFFAEAPPYYFIPTFGFAMVSMMVTRRKQRIGDLAAGTMVIVDERKWQPPHIQFEDNRVISLAEFIPATFRVNRSLARAIALYATRRRYLSQARRNELASIIGMPLIRKFGFREDTSSDLLLCSLYYREFIARDTSAVEAENQFVLTGQVHLNSPKMAGNGPPSMEAWATPGQSPPELAANQPIVPENQTSGIASASNPPNVGSDRTTSSPPVASQSHQHLQNQHPPNQKFQSESPALQPAVANTEINNATDPLATSQPAIPTPLSPAAADGPHATTASESKKKVVPPQSFLRHTPSSPPFDPTKSSDGDAS